MHLLTLPDTRTLDLPTRWGEVTLGQFDRLTELPDRADVYSFLSVFLDLAPVEVMNLPPAFVYEQVLPMLEFAASTTPDFASFGRPTVLHMRSTGGGLYDEVSVPTDLTASTFGQACDLGAILSDTAMTVPQKRIRALAILMHPYWQKGDYDSDAIDTFANYVCVNVAIEEALPLTDFFLSSTTAFAAPTSASSSASPSAPTSTPPASKPSWPSGMRWLWSTRWPLGTRLAGPTSSG
ncbi:hypothetical protein QMK33_19790 [Hymenobacter sp. H14-R3]|uniref:hypothetical protein n=1 Tax=Hymenobacter sp. H14-R3 TaxID=3046308 RepID=UPI0024B87B4F|nr:hypothetical protein [Hymenobacter sp. H14-R3]MDJ0367397.1 hypothetical protein [Hymenobacter sp. H14-R3]